MEKMNEMKSRIFGFVAVCLIVGSALGGFVLTVNAEPAKYGQVIGEYRGVEAYSNGEYTWTGMERYQCVEYVKRFYRQPSWTGNANQYYGKASMRGLEAYLNEGPIAPRADDILCFDNGGWGHVAIITGVDDNYVYIIEQNWDRNNAYKKLRWDKNTNKIYERGSYWIQGWLRSPTVRGGRYLSADLNCDNKVNIADFAILMSYWGTNGFGATSCRSPDINQDGFVDLTDFSIMMSQWTE